MVSFPTVRVKKRSLNDLGKMCSVVVVVIDCKTKKCLSAAEPAKEIGS